MTEMQPFRPLRECGHPADCTWFWKDANGGIHMFCIPCMAGILQKMGLRIYNYRNQDEFIREIGGKL
jgi:hypothetical protein